MAHKGKPFARVGRKAPGLTEPAGLPPQKHTSSLWLHDSGAGSRVGRHEAAGGRERMRQKT